MKGKIFIAFMLGLITPIALALVLGQRENPPDAGTSPLSPTVPSQSVSQTTISVLNDQGEVEEMELEGYLVGVVLAEMPTSFPDEALKAQAVVARTYTVRRQSSGKHDEGAVCMEPNCCQGYRAVDAYLAGGGTDTELEKVRQAVEATRGQILTYDAEPIDATYFSCSGGMTEAAVAVWGSDVPYLQAVESPGEEDSAHYTQELTFSPEEFARMVGLARADSPEDWFTEVRYTDGGGVDSIAIQGQSYRGTELRKALGLPSTSFTVTVEDGQIHITTRGFGHRVGMSQYGARAMAQSGSDYSEILAHYYPGTQLCGG